MATSSLLLILSIILFLTLTSLTFAAFSPSSVASVQLKLWSENVHSSMPEALLSKLSPLSMHDSAYFASLVTEKSFSSDANFCSHANLACSSKFNNYGDIFDGYNGYGKTRLSLSSEQTLDANSFFRMSILKKGNRVKLPNLHDQFPRRAFLPSEIASRISLNPNQLRKLFPESFSSSATKYAVQTTLLYCNAPNLNGEHKSCTKSLEEMIEFSQKVLGPKPKAALTSKSENGSGTEILIGNIKQFGAENFVACHEVFLPFATYLCHLLSSTFLYSIEFIEPKTKAPINTILAICHMDTSQWPEDHVAFKILKSSPGKAEACHFLTQIDLVWVRVEEGKI